MGVHLCSCPCCAAARLARQRGGCTGWADQLVAYTRLAKLPGKLGLRAPALGRLRTWQRWRPRRRQRRASLSAAVGRVRCCCCGGGGVADAPEAAVRALELLDQEVPEAGYGQGARPALPLLEALEAQRVSAILGLLERQLDAHAGGQGWCRMWWIGALVLIPGGTKSSEFAE